VVDDALALQHGLLGRVEGGGVVLEVLDQGAGLGPLVEDLGLALVDLLTAGHSLKPSPGRGLPVGETKNARPRSRPRSHGWGSHSARSPTRPLAHMRPGRN